MILFARSDDGLRQSFKKVLEHMCLNTRSAPFTPAGIRAALILAEIAPVPTVPIPQLCPGKLVQLRQGWREVPSRQPANQICVLKTEANTHMRDLLLMRCRALREAAARGDQYQAANSRT